MRVIIFGRTVKQTERAARELAYGRGAYLGMVASLYNSAVHMHLRLHSGGPMFILHDTLQDMSPNERACTEAILLAAKGFEIRCIRISLDEIVGADPLSVFARYQFQRWWLDYCERHALDPEHDEGHPRDLASAAWHAAAGVR